MASIVQALVDRLPARRRISRPGPAGRRPPASFTLVAVALVAAIGVNLVQFRGIDAGTVDNFDAIGRASTGDIVEQGFYDCKWCRQRFGPHLAIGVAAPGSRVIIPASTQYAARPRRAEELTFRLYAYGEVARVDWVDYRQPPELLDRVDPSPYIVASGAGGNKGASWALALDGVAADPDRYLADALRAGAHRDPAAAPRELVVLEWQDGPYRDLVLETSLLPDHVQDQLAQPPTPISEER